MAETPLRLEPLLSPDLALVLNNQPDRDSLFDMLAAAASRVISTVEPEVMIRAMVDRERRLPTSTPEGVAFPHAILPQIQECVLIPALITPPVQFGVRGHPPIDIAFGIFGCSANPMQHVKLLARLARIARGDGALDRIRACRDSTMLHACLVAEDRQYSG